MRQVIVSTSHRDVWTGETDEDGASGVIRLQEARHIFYWDAKTGGFGGLASNGPGEGSKIGPPISRVMIRDVVTVLDCSEKATARIRAQGWEQPVSGGNRG